MAVKNPPDVGKKDAPGSYMMDRRGHTSGQVRASLRKGKPSTAMEQTDKMTEKVAE